MLKRILMLCGASVLVVGSAAAQEEAPDLGSLGEPEWTIRIEPMVYFASPSGDLRLPSNGARGGQLALADLNLDSPRLSPAGRFMASRGKWRFAVSGLGFAASDRGAFAVAPGQIGGAPFAAGDRLVSDLSYQSFDLNASYRLLHHRRGGGEAGGTDLVVGVDVLAGLRAHHADFDVRVSPAVAPGPGVPTVAGADEVFAEPFVGGRLEVDFSRTFGIDVESSFGGFSTGDRGSFSFTIDAGFVYRPIPALGVRVGYHMLVFDLSDGDGAGEFEWKGSVAGLYWGAQLSF